MGGGGGGGGSNWLVIWVPQFIVIRRNEAISHYLVNDDHVLRRHVGPLSHDYLIKLYSSNVLRENSGKWNANNFLGKENIMVLDIIQLSNNDAKHRFYLSALVQLMPYCYRILVDLLHIHLYSYGREMCGGMI